MAEGARCYFCDKRISPDQRAVLIPIRIPGTNRKNWARAHVDCQPSVTIPVKDKDK
jgi:hypothetical protein